MRPIPGLVGLDGPLAAFLEANRHAFSRAELVGGWSRCALDTAVRHGRAARVLPGVYAAQQHVQQPQVLGEAILLWAPRTLVTGRLALHLYTPTLPQPPVADVIATNGDTLHPPPWVRVHQTGLPRESGSPGGVDAATPGRALLDAWRYAPPADRRSLLWEALWAKVCTWRQLKRELDRAARVAGRRDLERVLGWFAEGATTPLEVRAKHETFADARFRELEWQVPVVLPSRRVTLDALHRRAMVAVELDGDRYHSTRRARDDDRERQTDLTAAGFVVLRFGWKDITRRAEWCRERLLATVAGRLARPGSH